jgi:hypothetical protein
MNRPKGFTEVTEEDYDAVKRIAPTPPFPVEGPLHFLPFCFPGRQALQFRPALCETSAPSSSSASSSLPGDPSRLAPSRWW